MASLNLIWQASPAGGIGKVIGVMVGAFLIGVLNNDIPLGGRGRLAEGYQR